MQNQNINNRRDVTNSSDARGLSKFFQLTYTYMFMSLAITAVTAFILGDLFPKQTYMFLARIGIIGWIVMIGIQFYFLYSIGRHAMTNPRNAMIKLVLYAIFEGVMFSSIFIVYSLPSLAVTFVATAAVFAGTAAYGIFTKRDMSKLGPILFGLIIGLIVSGLLNMWLKNPAIYWWTSIAGVLIFSVYTAYDHNRLKNYYQQIGSEFPMQGLAINGALILYLDFINLFLYLLRFLGSRND